MSESDEFVVAHQSQSPGEAQIILSLLKDSGLNARIPDENTPFPGVDLTPLTQPGGAACGVYVVAHELERAREVIESARRSTGDDPE